MHLTLISSDYISTKEASLKYNYSMRHLRYWCSKKYVASFKHSRKWYVYEPSLKYFITNEGNSHSTLTSKGQV